MQVRTEIEIDAPPEEVWNVLADFGAYRDWNPFIVRVDGKLTVGARLTVTISPPESREMTFKPVVLTVEPGNEIRWRGHFVAAKLFQGEHFFRLTPSREGQTRFVHGEDFSGVLLKMLGPALTQTARGFVLMNQALKRRVEARGHSAAR